MLSQFTNSDARESLADYIDIPNVYAAGRLDKDSEGLLLLTDNGKLQERIADPKFKLAKHYWAQVENEVTDDALHALQIGVQLKDGLTLPAQAKRIQEPENLWERIPPIRFRKSVPTQWLNVVICEGRNRQVRRMTAASGNPTLRLIRHQIGSWKLGNLLPGQYKIINT